MAKPELGGKRQCQNCGVKFFDLNRDPIICPKCGSVFQAPVLSRAAARAAVADDDDDGDLPVVGAEIVSLEDAETGDAKVEAVVDDEVDLGDDGDDDTFLEEEEEDNDDVSGLIDGEIEKDEEG